jgi:hypothetical protein
MIMEPFSFNPSPIWFIALNCNATGLYIFCWLAIANFSAISVSAVPRITLALRSLSACACLRVANFSHSQSRKAGTEGINNPVAITSLQEARFF